MKIMKRLRRWGVVGLAFCLVVGELAVPGVRAVKDAQTMLENEMWGIYYYERDDCNDGKKCVAPTGDQITWIGDSYSVGALKLIQETFPGVDLGEEQAASVISPYTYIQGGKHTEQDAPEGSGGKSGITILKEIVDAGKLRPYLVFALGTNDTADAAATQKMMEEVADLVGNDTQVVITTASAKNQYQSDYVKANSGKKDFVASHNNFALADWAAVAKDEYFGDDTHPGLGDGYKVWVETIKNALPENCTDGVLLPGKNVAEKVWNWLTNYFNGQNLGSNISIPAVVSGVMGNFVGETAMNPFQEGYTGCYYGLFMFICANGGSVGGDVSIRDKVTAALGKNYFKQYKGHTYETIDETLKAEGLDEEQIDTAIGINLEALTQDHPYWSEFMKGLKEWGVADTASGYADLFTATIERAVNGSTPLEDAGVRKHYSGLYQGADVRRKYANEIYEKFASSTSINPTITTGQAANVARASASASATASATAGTNKNYAGDTVWSDDQMELIKKYESTYQTAGQQYGIPWQAIATVHRLETSLALKNPGNGQGLFQLYSYTGGGTNSNAFAPGEIDMTEFERQATLAAGEMKKMIEEGGYEPDSDEGIKFLFFYYNGTAERYKKKALAMGFSQEEANVGEGSPYVMNRYDARRDPNSSEMDPNWPGRFTADGVYTEGSKQEDFGAFVLYTALGGGSGSGNVCKPSFGGKLADYVLEYAWPEYHEAVFTEPMPEYKKVYDRRRSEGKYVGSLATYGDCGGFVTTIIQESGFDTGYNPQKGNTHAQELYVANSPDWELVNPSYNTPISDESELQPGDVAFNSNCGSSPGSCGHTYLYVGEIAGFGSHIASASWDRRSPMAGKESIVGAGINWYHKVK